MLVFLGYRNVPSVFSEQTFWISRLSVLVCFSPETSSRGFTCVSRNDLCVLVQCGVGVSGMGTRGPCCELQVMSEPVVLVAGVPVLLASARVCASSAVGRVPLGDSAHKL